MSLLIPHPAFRRALLVVSLLAASPAAAATLAFTGTTMNDTPPAMPSALCGAGQIRIAFTPANTANVGASNFGAFGASQAHCLTPPPTSYAGGVFDFAFEAGDMFYGTNSGVFTPTGTPNVVHSIVDYVITGGTGRFAGATGTIRGEGTLDRSVPRPLNNLALTGSLNLPAVPEPATWTLMLAGFGLLGGAMRRRRTAWAV